MKKTGVRIFTAILCAALLLGTAGCKKTEDAAGPEGKQTEKQPEQAIDGAVNGEEADGVTAMGRYMESEIPLPEGAGTEGRAMALLKDGRIAYCDANAGLLTTADDGESWTLTRGMDGVLPNNGGFVSAAAILPDESFAMVYVESEAQTLSSTLIIAGQNGGTVEIPGGLEGGDYLNRLFSDGEGGLYGISVQGKVMIADMEMKELKKLFQGADVPEMLAFTGKEMLALEREAVEIYDLSQNVLMEPDEVLDDFCREYLKDSIGNTDSMGAVLLAEGEENIYVAGRKGLFRHVRNGNAMEQLIDGSYSSLGSPMTSFFGLERLDDGEFLLLTAGESIIRFTYNPNQPTVPEKQLKVYSLWKNDRVSQAASQFRKSNPDAYVSYEYGMDSQFGESNPDAYGSHESGDTAMTAADALKNLNLELMSGDGPDVLLLDGMDAGVYEEKGLLRDLTPLLDSIAEGDELLTNVVSAYKGENGTYVIPANFKLPLLLGKEEDVKAITGLDSLADFMEKARGESPGEVILPDVNPEQLIGQLMGAESHAFLENGKWNAGELKNFLNQAKRIYDANRSGVDSEYLNDWEGMRGTLGFGSSAGMTLLGVSRISLGEAGFIADDAGVLDCEEVENFAYKLWPAQEGTGFLPANKLAVAAKSKQPELAESFVKLMLGRDMQEIEMSDGFPVDKTAFEQIIVGKEEYYMGGSMLIGGEERRFSHGYPGPETVARLIGLAGQANLVLEGNAVVEEAVMEFGVSVLEGEMSVEEAVSAIDRKTAIYLAE